MNNPPGPAPSRQVPAKSPSALTLPKNSNTPVSPLPVKLTRPPAVTEPARGIRLGPNRGTRNDPETPPKLSTVKAMLPDSRPFRLPV